jgi:hypothetical protein
VHKLHLELNFGFTHSVHCVSLKLPLYLCLVSAVLLKESTVSFNLLTGHDVYVRARIVLFQWV